MEKQLILRPSASSRWIACPASIRLSEGIPYEPSGEAAQIGTAIHALSESCYKVGTKPFEYIGSVVEGIKITEEMADFAQLHLDQIASVDDETGGNVHIEQYLTAYDEKNVKCGGTADVIAWNANKLIVADLKTGRGYVDEDSEQMKIYAIGAMNKSRKMFDEIELRIVQPHHGDVRVHKMTGDELTYWYSNTLVPAIDAVIAGDSAPNPTDKGCQWCPAKTVCPAQSQAVEFVSKSPAVNELTEDQLSVLLTKFDMVEDYIKKVREHAIKRMSDGSVLTGFQLVPKRATRSWIDPVEASKVLLANGVDIEQIYTHEIISPAVAEKLLGKANKHILEDITQKISSGLTLGRDASITLIPPTRSNATLTLKKEN